MDHDISIGALFGALQSCPSLQSMPITSVTRFMHCASLLKDNILLAQPNTVLISTAPLFLLPSITDFLATSFDLTSDNIDVLWASVKHTVWALPTEDEEKAASDAIFQKFGSQLGFSKSFRVLSSSLPPFRHR